MTHKLDRRAFLSFAGGALALPVWSRIAFAAAPTDRRFVVVILRGALDGLAALAPIGDPSYESARNGLALDPAATLKLDSTFALNPFLAGFKGLYDKGELTAFHAVAIPVRERSHFEAQAILETGLGQGGGQDGWLNRALKLMGGNDAGQAVAFSPSLPLILRGAAPATSFTPTGLPAGSDDFMQRVAVLYAGDAALGPALAKGLEVQAMATAAAHDAGNSTGDAEMMAAQGPGQRQQNLTPLASAAGTMLAREDGPRIAVLEAYGWDTHVAQGSADGQLARRLGNLDQAMTALREALGNVWSKTAIVIVTEFGRTVAQNGNKGTDHGTAAAAFLLGGAVKGGTIVADWPGLASDKLYEGRDLMPTRDIRSVLKGALAGQLGLDPGRLDRDVFPDSARAPALDGLIRA